MLVLMTCTLLVAAPITIVGGVIMALREDVGALVHPARRASRRSSSASASSSRAWCPQFRRDAGPHRPRQPGAARADHRHPGRAGLRPRARRESSASATPTTTSPRPRCDAGRLMALMFPTVMLVLNLSSVAAVWFGADRIDARRHADRRAGRLPQLPHADPDAGDDGHVHGDDGAPRRGLRRAHPGGARHRRRRCVARRRPGAPSCRPRRRSSCATSVPLPGRRGSRCCATSRSRSPPGRRPPSSAAPARARPRCSTSCPRLFDATAGAVLVDGVDVRDLDARAALEPHRPRAAEAVPVLRHRRQQPALRRARRHRRRAVGGARDRPGRRLRAGHARRPRRADRPGRHQRVGRPAPAPRHRPGARAQARASTCSTTRSRRSTSPPTPGCGPRSRPYTARRHRDRSSAQRVSTIVARRPDPRARGRPARSASARTSELLATCPTYAEIVASQLDRGGGGMSDRRRRRPATVADGEADRRRQRRTARLDRREPSPSAPVARVGCGRRRHAGREVEGLRRRRSAGCSAGCGPSGCASSPCSCSPSSA